MTVEKEFAGCDSSSCLAGAWTSRKKEIKIKKGVCRTLPLCLGGGHGLLSVVHELCLKYHKSLSQLFVCAEVVENAACLSQGLLGLSQGLVGQARWSG